MHRSVNLAVVHEPPAGVHHVRLRACEGHPLARDQPLVRRGKGARGAGHRERREVEREAADHRAPRILELEGGGEPARRELGGRPDGEGEFFDAGGCRAGVPLLEDLGAIDRPTGRGEGLGPSLPLAQEKGRIAILDLVAQGALREVREGGEQEQGEPSHREDGETGPGLGGGRPEPRRPPCPRPGREHSQGEEHERRRGGHRTRGGRPAGDGGREEEGEGAPVEQAGEEPGR